MDDDGIAALVTNLADTSSGTAPPRYCTVWKDKVPGEYVHAVGEWVYRAGGRFVPLATGVPAHWVVPIDAIGR